MNDALPHEQPPLTLAEERAASAKRRDTAFQEAFKRIRFSDDPYERTFLCGKFDPKRVQVP